ncbi:MAG: DUF4255 domain-containing protein [Candidatus Competibacteraceae bacterium]
MINDLDDTLKELLIQKVPIDLSAIDIKFEMPTKEWANNVSQSKPTVNLFLYDIRENHELRSNEHYLSRTGGMGSESRAPVRVDMTYLITAWASVVSDEHKLLGNILTTLLRYPIIPTDILKGVMMSQTLPIPAWIAQPERTPNAWDFWSSLDGRLKAGISYVVTVAIEPYPAEEIGLVTEKIITVKNTIG